MVGNELMGYPMNTGPLWSKQHLTRSRKQQKFSKTMIYKEKIISWLADRKRDKAIRNIREMMGFFGCELSHLSDQEIEEWLLEACKIIQNSGITTEEATKGFELASRGLSRHNYKEKI